MDVKIILPGIPDKKIAYSLAKTHYKSLLKSGVKLYEYTPGFVHAKNFVCDDKKAIVVKVTITDNQDGTLTVDKYVTKTGESDSKKEGFADRIKNFFGNIGKADNKATYSFDRCRNISWGATTKKLFQAQTTIFQKILKQPNTNKIFIQDRFID